MDKTFADIPENGLVENGKKKDYWYNVYKFTEKQEQEWREWALGELKEICEEDIALKVLTELDLKYGFAIRYKKEGELF